MAETDRLDDLIGTALLPLLVEPMRAADLAAAVTSADGLTLSGPRAAELLARLERRGLARVAGYEAGEARYVATSLGQRAATALATADPDLAIGLEDLERLRTDLLATVGHELRTPLTAIRTSVGLLLDPGLDPSEAQRRQLLGTIGRSADRMQGLLTELLDLARLRAGAIEMARDRFDARALARDVAIAVEPMAAARQQLVRLEPAGHPLPVVGDRRRLEQALLNLVSNAQKFSPSGRDVTIIVDGQGDGVRWTVVDQGPGIGQDEQDRLFERFFVGSSDGAARGGTGLGLPTALAIAQAHGGTIEVSSELGRGSTFRLVIPAAAP
ncbi:MAG TPA: HAMP domain-containing sensor histidine kinase [Candidatus Angelobacter sp.]|nr:HAMP domain-containing sensor histidine kinase [Candidatus Angelobacter sp.]